MNDVGFGFNKIYTENCLDTMKRMSEDFIDLTITSPPYDGLRTYNGYSFEFEKIAKELYRITKPGGVIIWVVGDSIENGSETLTSFKQAIYFKECGFNIHDTMIYKKTGMRFPEKKRYAQVFEYMFVISKGLPKTTNIIHDRPNRWAGYTNWGQNSVRKKEGDLIKIKDCKRYKKYGARLNIWEYSNGYGFGTKDKDSYDHPAMFPEQLVEDHMMSWSNEGDIVYDPFMGSGTTAKIAILTNRMYIGSEISEEYTQGAIQRISGLEYQRGSKLIVLKNEQDKRNNEENDHSNQIKESEKNFSKNRKWQPSLPSQTSNNSPEIIISDETKALQDSILGVETE
jgi:DNA modification methylase